MSGQPIEKANYNDDWVIKKEVARIIVSKYPELKVYLSQDRAYKEHYFQNMLDAIALGMMAYER